VFFVELSQGSSIDAFVERWGLVPIDLREDGPSASITLLTSTFLHAGWFHLAANMVYLGAFGFSLERRLGRVKYGLLYGVSAVIGSLAYVVAQPLSVTPAIGASGAIGGLIAARLMLFLHVIQSAPILLLLLLWLLTQFFIGVASLTTMTGVAWWAHLGGFASGLVLAPLIGARRAVR
jgi:membrane associated rhomboid family serine protease